VKAESAGDDRTIMHAPAKEPSQTADNKLRSVGVASGGSPSSSVPCDGVGGADDGADGVGSGTGIK
jgi:hypothetical protein